MERININKALTSKDNQQPPNAPSLCGVSITVAIKPIPILQNLVKSQVGSTLESRKIGKYKLINYEMKRNMTIGVCTFKHTLLTYKLGKTKYEIKSLTYITKPKGRPAEKIEGEITIIKGLFKKKMFKIAELPKNIIESINENIVIFNQEYEASLIAKKTSKLIEAKQKEQSFFEGLDV